MIKFFVALVMVVLAGCAAPAPAVPAVSATAFPTLPLPTATVPPTETATPTTEVVPTKPPTFTPDIPPTPTPAPATAAATSPAPAGPAASPTPPPAAAAASGDPVLVGAGDIAVCDTKGAGATAALIENIPGTVFTLGDDAYESGSADQFLNCYDPTWGQFKDRTMPVAGNHEYLTKGAAGYYNYFGAAAGALGQGYYSYNVGAWHIIVLNSEIDTGEKSPQLNWLRTDLETHANQCVAAMWHRPLFSSGPHGWAGDGKNTQTFWQMLYDHGADLILNGHDHDYERFAPQDPQGNADPARGIREFVVGTGGAAPYPITKTQPTSELHRVGIFGVMKLTLHADSYDWQFVPVTGPFFGDSGHGECH